MKGVCAAFLLSFVLQAAGQPNPCTTPGPTTLAPTTTPGPTTTVTTVYVAGPCTTEVPTTLAPTTTPGPTTTVITLPGPCTTVVALKLYSDGDKAFLKKTVEKQAPTANEPAASAAGGASFYLFTGFGVLGAVMAVIGVVRGVTRPR